MSNEFNKEERVAFEDILEGFNDELILSNNVSRYNTGDTQMERSSDVIWRPMPYIAQSFDGMDQTSNFQDNTQLAVPATLGFSKSVPWILDAKELRDQLQEGRLGQSAKQKLASDINVAIMNVAALQGTLVVDIATAASGASGGYDSVAEADAAMNEIGVPMGDRYAAFSSRVYNGLASDLADRETLRGKALTAYEKSSIGLIAGFGSHKMDYANRIALQVNTNSAIINAANQFYTPVATRTASTGEKSNVDNRYQQITVQTDNGALTDITAGDAFTVANVLSVHLITKQATAQNKTFRVISVDSDTAMTISPPMISNGGGTDAEAQYQNIDSTPANGAAITFLNIAAADVNPFWHKDALEILPGRYAVPTDAGTGVMRGTTENGIEVVMQKDYDIDIMKTKYRCDVLFGVVNKQPEMTGVIIYGQT